MKILPVIAALTVLLGLAVPAEAQDPGRDNNPFRQLYEELPTPNNYRTASGAPGHEYYQQRADYILDVRLDENARSVTGEGEVTYHNNSPDVLEYLWLQLDQNMWEPHSDYYITKTGKAADKLSAKKIYELNPDFDGGFRIAKIEDAAGRPLPYTINRTMMRIDLTEPLMPSGKVTFRMEWSFNIHDRVAQGGKAGYEYFPEDGNCLFAVAQFFPRMAVYNDVEGWQNHQFLGKSEFALPFGDYEVNITVPEDHLVAATGVLVNPEEVLTDKQRDRLEKAAHADSPVLIVTEEEARRNERSRATGEKTWQFRAENVRDFGWASSRKHIWDAWGVEIGGRIVMAMSMYPKECNPLWEQYSTKTIAHTLRHYSNYLFDYPYPVAWSVHAKSLGMEYPMFSFNWGRPEADGSYTSKEKYYFIGVVIHEIGHNWFPMIVNSDERKWAWMDESINSFTQYTAEQTFERDFPHRRGEPHKVIPYMKGDKSKMSPIMSNPDYISKLGSNAYTKGTTALNILRETILGRELFDFAFKTYANRWKFKHPTPADFFRTMEDASGTDLDWFWRGWFFSTDHVDISLDEVAWYKLNTGNPELDKAAERAANDRKQINITDIRNDTAVQQTYVEEDPALRDFYNSYDPYEVTLLDRMAWERVKERLNDEEVAALEKDWNFYELTFSNKGGLVMPLILQFEFSDGETRLVRIPAEIWRFTPDRITKLFAFEREVVRVQLDPYGETADVDTGNNSWPQQQQPTRFDLYINKSSTAPNPIQMDEKLRQLEEDDF